MKKRMLKEICDYWEAEARRSEAAAALWQRRCRDAERSLAALRADPLGAFRAGFQAEAIRQIDAWPSGPDAHEPTKE
jgi:hypothetical protein